MEQRWTDLVSVLERYAAARTEPAAAADALCRAAELAATRLADTALAHRLYQLALERCPDYLNATHGLLRLAYRQRAWEEAAVLIKRLIEESESNAERAHLQLDLARITELWLKKPAPIDMYVSIIERSPQGARLRFELFRMQQQTSNIDGRFLLKLGEQTSDPQLGSSFLLQGAYLNEFGGGSPSDLDETIKLAWSRQPTDLAIRWAYERHLLRQREWSELGQLLATQAEYCVDKGTQAREYAMAAQACYRGESFDEAEAHAKKALSIEAGFVPALRLLASLYEQQNNWPALGNTEDALSKAADNPANRRDAAMHAADIWASAVSDAEQATQSVKRALREAPGDAEAFQLAVGLFRQAGQFQELVTLYQQRIKATRQMPDRIDLLRELAKLHRQSTKDMIAVITTLRELLLLTPTDVEAMAELAEVLCREGRWSEAAETLMSLIARTTHNETPPAGTPSPGRNLARASP